MVFEQCGWRFENKLSTFETILVDYYHSNCRMYDARIDRIKISKDLVFVENKVWEVGQILQKF